MVRRGRPTCVRTRRTAYTEIIAPDQSADTTTMPGLDPGTLTLRLPVQRPEVTVPVVELFLGP